MKRHHKTNKTAVEDPKPVPVGPWLAPWIPHRRIKTAIERWMDLGVMAGAFRRAMNIGIVSIASANGRRHVSGVEKINFLTSTLKKINFLTSTHKTKLSL